VHLADRLELPTGYRARPYRGRDDHRAMAGLVTDYRHLHGIDELVTTETLDHEFDVLTGFEPDRDVALIEHDGDLVAYCRPRRHELANGFSDLLVWAPISPDHLDRALFGAMIRAQEAQLRDLAGDSTNPRYRARSSHPGPDSMPTGEAAWLEECGYEATYWDAVLRRPHLDDIADLPLPTGVEVRPVTDDQVRTIVVTHHEAFRGEWDFFEATESDLDAAINDPINDTSLWQVAWDGDTVVGQVKPFINDTENAERGYLRGYTEFISTHRDYRNRGIAGALLARALHAIKERGMTEAVLGVDMNNPGGAFHLYRKLGFEVESHEAYYTKPVS
jgi:ribosomal protein S18 acetylase RimI-like enzyme